jgi:hypothetical protein
VSTNVHRVDDVVDPRRDSCCCGRATPHRWATADHRVTPRTRPTFVVPAASCPLAEVTRRCRRSRVCARSAGVLAAWSLDLASARRRSRPPTAESSSARWPGPAALPSRVRPWRASPWRARPSKASLFRGPDFPWLGVAPRLWRVRTLPALSWPTSPWPARSRPPKRSCHRARFDPVAPLRVACSPGRLLRVLPWRAPP